MRIPPLLKPGDAIRLVSPSFKVERETAESAHEFWREAGFKPEFGVHALGQFFNYSASDDDRLADLQAAFDDPQVRLVHCLRGGYGLTRYLDRLDLRRFIENPKWLVGFSDITALLLALESQSIACIHGPMASHFREAKVRAALIEALTKGTVSANWKDESAQADVSFEGSVTGGNLTLLAHTTGSRYPLDSQGKILFLEEVGEQLYHTDRMMLQLRRAGKLEGLAGLLVGHFTEMKDTATPFGNGVEQIVLDHAARYGYPIVFSFPAGHHPWNLPLPFGVPLHIERREGQCWLSGQFVNNFA